MDVGLEGVGHRHDRCGDRDGRLRLRPPPRPLGRPRDGDADREKQSSASSAAKFARAWPSAGRWAMRRRPRSSSIKPVRQAVCVPRRRSSGSVLLGRSSRPGSSTTRSAAASTVTTWRRGSRSASGISARPTRRCSTRRPRVERAQEQRAGRPSAPSVMLKDLRPGPSFATSSSSGSRSTRRPTWAKDAKLYPGSRYAADRLRPADVGFLDLFLEDVAWGESSDFRRLLLAGEIFRSTWNGRLARVYGRQRPPGRRPLQEGEALDPEAAGRGHLASVPAGDVRVHRRRARRSTGASSCRGACSAGRSARRQRPSPRSPADSMPGSPLPPAALAMQTNPAACRTSPRDDQPCPRLHPGGLRRHRPIPGQGRRRQAGRRLGDVPVSFGRHVVSSNAPATWPRSSRRQRGGPQTAFVEKLFHQVVKQPIPAAYGPDRQGPSLRHSFARHRDFKIRRPHGRDRRLDSALGLDAARSAPGVVTSLPRLPPSRSRIESSAKLARSPPKNRSPSPTRRNNRGHRHVRDATFLRATWASPRRPSRSC